MEPRAHQVHRKARCRRKSPRTIVEIVVNTGSPQLNHCAGNISTSITWYGFSPALPTRCVYGCPAALWNPTLPGTTSPGALHSPGPLSLRGCDFVLSPLSSILTLSLLCV